jgi:hypothetical protein
LAGQSIKDHIRNVFDINYNDDGSTVNYIGDDGDVRELLRAGPLCRQMLGSMIAAYLAGPNFYWLPGAWIGGTFLLAGWLGQRNVRRQMAQGRTN